MKKARRHLAGLIFAVLGLIFFYLDMAPAMDHASHSKNIGHGPTNHGTTLLGIGEMTWMWFSMALVHFFLSDKN